MGDIKNRFKTLAQ